MNPDQLARYSRHISLPEMGLETQEKLLSQRALIVGMGGLGSPVAMYLAASGVGTLVLADFDHIELSNLQRQIAHTTDRIGELKTHSARDTCRALNPDVRIETIDYALDDDDVADAVAAADIVIDCSDNFPTRFAVNAACVETRTPLVSGAAIRFDGQVCVLRCDKPDAPCYRCLYQDGDEAAETCSRIGVLAPVVGVIGSIQALEAIKVLTDIGDTLESRLLLLDGRAMQWQEIRLRQDPTCPLCQERTAKAG
ncbi:MAG TPA: molybdopterin-synthase adenylyltransferase MoeB [Gammaproteobacteria bacterium]|jgi:adenylyltransferase/sulfurtransferase|nr:molybdopterin-synthase adenylyltransferase MoeB [Gammaproteobacteria bacterium]